MKRFLLASSLLLLAPAMPASAQYAPGMISFGGSARYSAYDAPDGLFDNDYTEFQVEPQIGLSLNEGVMVGTKLFFGIVEQGDLTTVGILPFIRKNSAIAEKAGAYVSLSPFFVHSSGPDDFFMRSMGIGADAGVYYFIARRFSLELSLFNISFGHDTFGSEFSDEQSTTSFSMGYDMVGAGVSVLSHF